MGEGGSYTPAPAASAVMIPVNVDRDSRALPGEASIGQPVVLDVALAQKSASDDDLLRIRVNNKPEYAQIFTSLVLRVSGENATAVNVLDDRRRYIQPLTRAASQVDYPASSRVGRQIYWLEAKNFAGSPMVQDSVNLTIAAIGRDASGTETVLITIRLSLPHLMLLDDTAPAERLYICDVEENYPSVSDVRAAVGDLVKLCPITLEHNMGDAWIQDQFRLGYAENSKKLVLLHLPRLRQNAQLGTGKGNLQMLVRSHFPSKDVGVIEDFWQRRVPVWHLSEDGSEVRTDIAFPDTEPLFLILHKVREAAEFLYTSIDNIKAAVDRYNAYIEAYNKKLDPKTMAEKPRIALPHPSIPKRSVHLPDVRRSLPQLLRALEQILERLLSASVLPSDEFPTKDFLKALRTRARAMVSYASGLLSMSGSAEKETFELAIHKSMFRLSSKQLVALDATVTPMHDNLVYGGNFLVSPPMADAPRGKVVIGEEPDSRPLDVDLHRLLDAGAGLQPVVTLDTSWLDVGHVDELIAFLPKQGRNTAEAVIVHASPAVALSLCSKAENLYRSGLPSEHPDRLRQVGFGRHHMSDGAHFVTRLFRGKLWLHLAQTEVGQGLEPPTIYRALAYSKPIFVPYSIYLRASQTQKHYPAAISVREMLWLEEKANDVLVKTELAETDDRLRKNFPGMELLAVPVLFDKGLPTTAFTPNLANLQYVNGTVLVPNPFGPRMRPDDALTIVKEVLREQDLGKLAASISRGYLRKRELDVNRVWLNGKLDPDFGFFGSLKEIVKEFSDAFGTISEQEISEKFLRSNSSSFNNVTQELKPGWKNIIIPEESVDLFQAYTQIVLESLSLRVKWIDTWYYHVRGGEIHCGTNVLRRSRNF